jgi:hypothetical protein
MHITSHFASIVIPGLSALSLAALLASCSSEGGSDSTNPGTTTPASSSYTGTASVGDCITVTVDHVAHTIAYSNLSNGDNGTATYTTASDGSLAITDTAGRLLKAFEVPGYALVIAADKTGPGHDQKAIITAIEATTITAADIASSAYNYMQFRTNNGGMEIGSVVTASDGSLTHEGYWPYGSLQSPDQSYLGSSAIPASAFTAGPANRYLTVDDGGGNAYIFRTTGGFLAVDTTNGGLVCLKQKSSTAFDTACAGTYKAVTYHRHDAHMDFSGGGNGVESAVGTNLSLNRVVFTSTAGVPHVIVYAGDDVTKVVDTDLQTMAAGGFVGSGKLSSTCPGMYTFTVPGTGGGNPTQVFVGFLDHAAILSSFTPGTTMGGPSSSQHYDYFYGVALQETTPGAGG